MPIHPINTSDEELVIHYQKTKDKLLVGELYKRHSLMCFAVCNKYFKHEEKAKDAAMAVFEKLFDDLLRHTPHNFKSWLYSVCKNYCLMQLRKPVVEVSLEENEDSFVEFDKLLHPTNDGGAKERKLRILEEAITQLNTQQKVCIELFYIEQKTYHQVSEATGYTLNEVKSHIQNGKRNLKNILAQKGIYFSTLLVWILHI